MPMKRVLAAAAAAALCCSPAAAQPQTDVSKVEIKTTDLGGGVYLLGWPGGDSLVLTGADGVLLVDAAVPQMVDNIRAAIARLSDKPIRFVINTHAHADHFGGNEAMARAGAVIVAQDNVRVRMAKGNYIAAFNQTIPPSAPGALPTVTYADAMTIHFDGEAVELIHAPLAHTDSDSLVYFRRADVIHASGTFGPGMTYPFFDLSSGGSLAGMIAAQEKLLSLADDRTRIIPDEGDPEGKAAIQASHDMLVIVRRRVQALIAAGKSEDQAVAAKPTRDLDGAWVHKGGYITGDLFTRMAYESLKGIKPPTAPKATAAN
jgi:glyoxylase-like metal-dependent hydrolase (beta-lactamase superfamily II)